MLVSAGAVLCLFAAPAGALAGTSSTQVIPGATHLMAANNNPAPDTCGYPDASSAKSATVFNEDGVAEGISVIGSGATAQIAAFGTDEASVLLGIMPTNPNGGVGHLSNPSLGNTSIKDPSGRPLAPTIYTTDLTANGPNSRAGDWQQGGAGSTHIDDIFGTWTTATGDPNANNYSATKPASNGGNAVSTGNFTSVGGDVAPPPAAGNSWLQYSTEVRWNAASLGLIPGHTYRIQVILHDGDQNKSGGDVGELCTPLAGVVIPNATFSLAKSVDPATSPVPVGTPLNYTITLKNTSANTAGDPGVVTDTITTTGGLTYHLATTPAPAASVGTLTGPVAGVFSWSPGNLTAGQSVTLKYTLIPDSVGGINNVAVNKNTNCPDANTATGCTTHTDVVAYKLSKSVSPSGPVRVGTPLTYTVTISNLSSTVAGNPGTITDTPSTVDGATFDITTQPSTSLGSVTPLVGGPGPQFAWTPGTLPAGGQATLSMVLTPTSAGTGANPAVDNTAFDTSTNCPTPGMAGCTTNTPLTNFSLAKSVSPTGTVTIGSTLTYTVTVTNLTDQAGDPGTVLDHVSSNGVGYSIVGLPKASVGGFTGSNPDFSWTPGSLPANGSATLTIVLHVDSVTAGVANPTVTNTAYDTNTNCPTPGNPTCTRTTPVTDFLMSKSVSPTGAVTVGDTLTYTVKITNTTATAGDPATVADTITSNGVQFVVTGGPSTAHGTVSTIDLTHYSWAVGPLAGNESATLTLVIKVTGVTAGTVNPTIVNTAVDVNTNCATANNPDCTTNTPLIVLTLTKTVDKTSTVLNDTLTYTIKVGNTGAATATNVLVDDVFGGTAGYQVNDGTLNTTNSFAGSPSVPVTKLANGHYQWTYPALKPGDVATVTFTAKIELPFTVQANTSGTITLTNTVSVPTYVTGVGTYVNPGNNPPPVTVSTVAPYNGGVQGCSTSNGCGVPNTGTSLNITLAGFLFLGGLGLILIGALARKREDTIS